MSDVPVFTCFSSPARSPATGSALRSMQALRQRCGSTVRFSGVGGTQMAAQGLPSLFPLGDLAIVGFACIPMQLPKILQRIRETADAVIAARPDVLVIIDSPEFTHRVARKVRESAPAIPIVDYVCPSVWAWRPGRARAMRGYIDHVLTLLPFEPAALRTVRRTAFHLCRASAQRARRGVAPKCRGGATAACGPAATLGAARQPHRRDWAACGAFRKGG